jgi:WD40 repeat protein
LLAITVSFSPDSSYLISVACERAQGYEEPAAVEHTATLWEVTTQREIAHQSIGGRLDTSADAGFSPDGNFVTADDFDGDHLSVFTVPKLTRVTNLVGHAARFLKDSRTLVYASSNTVIRTRLEDGHQSEAVIIVQRPQEIGRVALSTNDDMLAITSDDEPMSISFWDPRGSGRYLRPSKERHLRRVHQIALSPDGRTLASIAWDGKLGLWDVASGRNKAMLPGHLGEAYGVAFSPDGRTIASAGPDCVRLWNVATLREIADLKTDAMMDGVAFSPNGEWLAAAGNDGTVHLWHAPPLTKFEAKQRP